MTRFGSLLIVWLLALTAYPAFPQTPPQAFVDAKKDHWAYEAMVRLRERGIVVGYPDGHFRGNRTLSRYEFAVAIQRAFFNPAGAIPGQKGPMGDRGTAGAPGPAGEQGEAGPMGPAGIGPAEVSDIRRLITEFKSELAGLGTQLSTINRRLEQLGKNLADVKSSLARMPTISGGAWVGIRSDISDGSYVDRDGRIMGIGAAPSLGGRQVVAHDLYLNLASPIAGGAALDAGISATNYKNYLGGSFATDLPLKLSPSEDIYLHHLELSANIGTSRLTLGRFGEKATRFTLWRQVVDSYLRDPFSSDDRIYMDGARIESQIGRVKIQAFAGQTSSVQGVNGGAFNSPIAGIATGAAGTTLLTGSQKPIGQPLQGQMLVTQLAGGIASIGSEDKNHLKLIVVDAGGTAGTGFNNVIALGAEGGVRAFGRFRLDADWGKTLTGTGRTTSVNAHNNNAFQATLGWKSRGLSLAAGYKYVDELFYNPAYWARFGNWINPVNFRGVEFRSAFDVSQALNLSLGLDYFNPIHDRSGVGGFGSDDDINRVLVGVHWKASDAVGLGIAWEGVRYHLRGAHSGIPLLGAGNVHAAENYIDFTTSYRLTSNTQLKLLYQVASFFGHGSVLSGAGTRYNFNAFAMQAAVRF